MTHIVRGILNDLLFNTKYRGTWTVLAHRPLQRSKGRFSGGYLRYTSTISSSKNQSEGALEGVKILDLSRVLAVRPIALPLDHRKTAVAETRV